MVVFSIAAVVVVIAIARCAAAAPFLHSSLTSGDLKSQDLPGGSPAVPVFS